MWMVIVAIVAASGIYVFKSCVDAPARNVNAMLDSAAKNTRDLAAALIHGTVTTQFREYCTETRPDLSLQVASLKQIEQFTRTDEAVVGGIPLPDVIVRVTAPVQYTYSVDLNSRWEFRQSGNTLTVICPNPKPGVPAFDVSAMEWEVKKDSLFRRTSQVMDDLKKTVMPMAQSRGKAHIPTIRETARAQVATFVDRWVQQKFTDSSQFRIKVLFASESEGQNKNFVPHSPESAQ